MLSGIASTIFIESSEATMATRRPSRKRCNNCSGAGRRIEYLAIPPALLDDVRVQTSWDRVALGRLDGADHYCFRLGASRSRLRRFAPPPDCANVVRSTHSA